MEYNYELKVSSDRLYPHPPKWPYLPLFALFHIIFMKPKEGASLFLRCESCLNANDGR